MAPRPQWPGRGRWVVELVSLLTFAGPLLAALGLGWNGYAFRRNTDELRAATAARRMETFLSNESIRKAFNQVDLGKFKFENNKAFFENDALLEIDTLLRFLSELCALIENGRLRSGDITTLRYYVLRVARDQAVQNYVDSEGSPGLLFAMGIHAEYRLLKPA